jgi:hypothetical protein
LRDHGQRDSQHGSDHKQAKTVHSVFPFLICSGM